MLENQNLFHFNHSSASYLSVSVIGFILFRYFGQHNVFPGRKRSLALHFVEMDPDPGQDRQSLESGY
jgi:hypothetical protein